MPSSATAHAHPDIRSLNAMTGREEILSRNPVVARWEVGVAAGILLLSTGTWLPLGLITRRAYDPEHGDFIVQAVWTFIFLFCLFRLDGSLEGRFPIAIEPIAILPITVSFFALVSASWSVAPVVSLKRALALCGTTVIGLYFAKYFTWARFYPLLLGVTAASTFLSLLALVVMTPRAISGDGFQGIYSQKNWLGREMSLTVVLWALPLLTQRRYRALSIPVVASSAFLLLESRSATAIATTVIVGTVVVGYIALTRTHRSVAAPLTILGTMFVAWLLMRIVANPEQVLNMLGKNMSLSGRTELWSVAISEGTAHSWIGNGYGGFWLGWNGPSSVVWSWFQTKGGWRPPSAHNGFIDVWLDFGVLGLGLVGACLIMAIRNAAAWRSLDSTNGRAIYPITLLLLLILFNTTESILLAHSSLYWILLTMSVVKSKSSLSAAANVMSEQHHTQIDTREIALGRSTSKIVSGVDP